MKTSSLDKQLKELGIDPVETRPTKIVYVVTYSLHPGVEREIYGAYDEYYEAMEKAKRAYLPRYDIEEKEVYYDKEDS